MNLLLTANILCDTATEENPASDGDSGGLGVAVPADTVMAAASDGDSGGLGVAVPADTKMAAAADGDSGGLGKAVPADTEMAAAADGDNGGLGEAVPADTEMMAAVMPAGVPVFAARRVGDKAPGNTLATAGDALKGTRAANASKLSVIEEGMMQISAKDEEFNRLLAQGKTTALEDERNYIAFKSMCAATAVVVPTTQDALVSLNSDSDSASNATQSQVPLPCTQEAVKPFILDPSTVLRVLPGGMHVQENAVECA